MDERLHAEVAHHPYRLLCATLCGAHLYGFPSPDSRYFLRGAHILPARDLFSFLRDRMTLQQRSDYGDITVDFVTHDVKKLCQLLLNDSEVLEQVHSPLVLHTTTEHEELKAIARDNIRSSHGYHYQHLADRHWRQFVRKRRYRIRHLLHAYRSLFTGIHLMRTGELEMNLIRLNDIFNVPFIPELVAFKLAGTEHASLPDADSTPYEREFLRARSALEEAQLASILPFIPPPLTALDEFVVRLRLDQ